MQWPSTPPRKKPSIAPALAKAPSSSKPKPSAAAATRSTTPLSTFRPSSASIGKNAIPSPFTRNSSPLRKFSTPKEKKKSRTKSPRSSKKTASSPRTLRCLHLNSPPRASTAPATIATRSAPSGSAPVAEVTPPKSSVEPVWTVEGFGRGKTSSRENAPIHFGDTQPAADEPVGKTKSPAKPNAKSPARKATPAKSAARGKARR